MVKTNGCLIPTTTDLIKEVMLYFIFVYFIVLHRLILYCVVFYCIALNRWSLYLALSQSPNLSLTHSIFLSLPLIITHYLSISLSLFQLPQNLSMLTDIIHSCWGACILPDPGSADSRHIASNK